MKHRRFKTALIVSALSALILTGWGVSFCEGENHSLRTRKEVLDNGLTVLVTEMPGHKLVSIYALVKVGSAMEGPYLGGGITHFVEHMLFKGTERRGVGEISREVQSLGGTINASTSLDYTVFTLTVPGEHFEKGLDILTDMLTYPRFDSEEVEREKQVIVKEIRLHKDQPERVLSEMVFETVFTRHPYRIPVIGFENIFLKISRDDLVQYFRTFYVPNNIVFSVAGDVFADTVLPQIEKAFASAERGNAVVRNLPPEPSQISRRERADVFPTDLTRLSLTYSGVSISDADMFALDVLAMILGNGRTSRLYQDLFLERQLVKSVTVSDYTPLDRGVLEIECVLDHDRIDDVVKAAADQIERIKRRGVTEAELDKARRQVLSEYLTGLQTTGDVAWQTAMDEAMLADFDFSRKYIAAVGKVDNAAVKAAARKYLKEDSLSVVVLKPKSGGEPAGPIASDRAPRPEIEIVKPDNGLTLLFRRDPAVPLVSLCIALNGGVRVENSGNNGISALIARTWNKGTSTMSADEIAGRVESRGASVGGFSGYNSFGLTAQALAEDMEDVFDITMDILMNPAFNATELDKEKDKMKTAILDRQDSIFDTAFLALRKGLFPGNPLGMDELGTLESVDGLTRDDVVDYYWRYVAAGNMTVSLFGDFSPALKERMIERFSRLKTGSAAIQPAAVTPIGQPVEKIAAMDKSQVVVAFGFQAAGYTHPDRYGLELLAALLGSSFQGRIFQTIREEFGQAYTLGGDYQPALDGGMLVFYVSTTAPHAAKVQAMLRDILHKIAAGPVDERELSNMKAYLKGRQAQALEPNSALGFRAALDTLYGLGPEYYQQFDAAIDSVTPEDIQRLAKEYLDFEKSVLVLAGQLPGD